MKTFDSDFNHFVGMLKDHIPFALGRFGDGELAILRGFRVGNNEFQYPGGQSGFRDALWTAFRYQHPRYYVGIVCPCCQNHSSWEWMRQMSGQDDSNLTWNNIWVNSHYRRFLYDVLPLFDEYQVVLICNEDANHMSLPFETRVVWKVPDNAWKKPVMDYVSPEVIDGIKKDGPTLVLSAAGPTSEPFISYLHKSNEDVTMLDIGSTLDPWLFPGERGRSRGYLKGMDTSNKTCVWGDYSIPPTVPHDSVTCGSGKIYPYGVKQDSGEVKDNC